EIFIGACSIKINELDLGLTLESSPTKLVIKKDVTEVKPSCKGGATVKAISKTTSITAEATVLYNGSLIQSLMNELNFNFNEDFQILENVSVKFKSDSVIELLECNVKLEQIINFKKNTASEVKLIITALKTRDGYYKMGGSF
ncbi:MAG: hypothetical protein ACRC0F_05740, partial [Cetobacterium sp.]